MINANTSSSESNEESNTSTCVDQCEQILYLDINPCDVVKILNKKVPEINKYFKENTNQYSWATANYDNGKYFLYYIMRMPSGWGEIITNILHELMLNMLRNHESPKRVSIFKHANFHFLS